MATSAVATPPTIRGYDMLRLLGQGGMGQVWLADDQTLGRRVAIKTVAAARAREGRARGRLLREARAMATVEHPHVVRLYAYGDAAGLAYFVMEFVDGETLAAHLRRTGQLEPGESLRIARQVALALSFAWQRGVVHRDVKPSNVLLDAQSVVRVADFGLARAATTSGDESLTAAGAVVGSPHYMSPEQARGRSVDFRSDLYSLGVVLFEMLAGARPFQGSSPVEVMAHHIHDPLPPLGHRRPGLPPGVVALVEDMTAKEPERRPPSYGALLERIDGSARGELCVDTTSEPTSTLPSGRRSKPKRRRVLAGLLALAITGAVGILWSTRGPSGASAPAGSLAIAALYGPDEVSAREGRLLAALAEAEVSRRLGESLRVVGAEEAGPPVRSESAARALAARLKVDAVMWGQVLSFGARTEAQSWVTTARSSEPLAVVVIESAEGPGALDRRRVAAQALADALLVAAAKDALDARPGAAARLAEKAGVAPEARTLAEEARRRLAPPATR